MAMVAHKKSSKTASHATIQKLQPLVKKYFFLYAIILTMSNDIILLKQGEIILKGQNRREFEKRLLENIKRRISPFGKFKVYAMQSAVYIEPQDGSDIDEAFEALKTVFGAVSLTRAAACEKNKDAIVREAEAYLGETLKSVSSFKDESKRADKSFPMSSIELSQYVGGALHAIFPHLTPDMHSPELTIFIEVRDLAAYVHGPAQRGAGGLPIGTGGKMATLLSGGIDSPVASYMMAKRGASLVPIHFYSHPYTSEQAKEKVAALARKLSDYCGRLRVEFVPFTRISEEIRKKSPDGYVTVIMRRFMLRIAERIAKNHGCSAIITGDNLGQVASQTAEALIAADECVSMPIFRPLIAFDKIDIMNKAREIGTFDISSLPFEDCCTVFTPKKPRTKPRLSEVLTIEATLDIDALIEDALVNP